MKEAGLTVKHYEQMVEWFKGNKMNNQEISRSIFVEHVKYTAIAATIAAIAAAICGVLNLPVWTMFIGWVAFFTRGLNGKHTAINLLCVWLGIMLGMLAGIVMSVVNPALGSLTLPLIVFVVAMLVISLRSVPLLNNLLCYFLGLISFFASHTAPSIENFSILASAATIGSLSGLIAFNLQKQST